MPQEKWARRGGSNRLGAEMGLGTDWGGGEWRLPKLVSGCPAHRRRPSPGDVAPETARAAHTLWACSTFPAFHAFP